MVNQGTTVRIKIPLTLAIIPALIIRCGDQRYAIPQVNLEELVHLNSEAQAKDVQVIGSSEFYRLRGQILPLVRLRNVLGLEGGTEEADGGVNIVVLNSGDRQFGLVVDGISDSEEIVVKPLGSHLKHIPFYAGTTLMGDGRVALILDVVGLSSYLKLKGEESLQQKAAVAEKVAADEERQFLLLFTVGEDEYFALPLALVNRLDKIAATDIEMVGGREVVQYRGHSMPIIRMENFLPISPLAEADHYHLIVFHMNGKDIAFLVSQIDDSLDIAVDVEEHTFRQEGLLGSAIIKDRTTLFVDVYQLIQMYDPDFFAAPQTETVTGGRILLAEDSTFYRNLLSSYLEAAGFDVVTAEDGKQAWDKLQAEPFDLLITDIEMPNMNGFELTKQVRSSEALKDLPIIAVTSLSGEDDRRKGLEAGVNDYQPKLDRDQVLEAVGRLLNEARYSQAA